MPLFGKRRPAPPPPPADDQAAARAAYDASTVHLGRGAACRIDGSGGEYYEPVPLAALSALVTFIDAHGDRAAEYGTRPAWEGYAYLVPRPGGTVEVVANGMVVDQVVGAAVEVVQTIAEPVPVRCTVQRFAWQRGEWWTVKVNGKTKKAIADTKRAASQPDPPSPT